MNTCFTEYIKKNPVAEHTIISGDLRKAQGLSYDMRIAVMLETDPEDDVEEIVEKEETIIRLNRDGSVGKRYTTKAEFNADGLERGRVTAFIKDGKSFNGKIYIKECNYVMMSKKQVKEFIKSRDKCDNSLAFAIKQVL